MEKVMPDFEGLGWKAFNIKFFFQNIHKIFFIRSYLVLLKKAFIHSERQKYHKKYFNIAFFLPFAYILIAFFELEI